MPFTLLASKELASTYQSLLLADVTLTGGSVLRLATHAVTYAGNAYVPRLANQEIAASQALSEQAIDIPATVNLRIADDDYYIWTNIEKVTGLKGSQLKLTLVQYDVQTATFSSDAYVIFRGVCREPGGRLPFHDGKTLSVGYASKLGLGDISLPSIRIQKTCPWMFPGTLAQRQDGADNSRSDFYQCGYSQDASGGNARGSLVGGVVATTCNRTKEDCVARGMYSKDSLNRATGRFGGVQWAGPQGQTVREYRTGNWSQVQGGANEARYGDYVPLLWGKSWTDPLILTYAPDGNYLKMEALICYGALDYIYEVVVNDTTIPHTFDDTLFTAVPPGIRNATEASRGGWWKTTNRGTRDGSPTADAGFNDGSGVPQGDPYGSFCVIEIVVPRKLADVGSQPRVRVLAERGSSNPATQLADVLQDWCAWQTAELNTSSASACESIADSTISYTDQFGGSSTRKRFTSGLYVRQRESAADIVRGLRNCGRMILGVDQAGLLLFRVKRTLADQQPAPVSGSNYNTAIASQTASGSAANGYAAYKFDASNIEGLVQVVGASSGNKFSLTFQNADNRNSWDSFNPIDSEDITRIGREVAASFLVKGVNNYDQMQRLVATYSAEQSRGNWRGDTGGTLLLEFTASVRASHLAIGDLVLVDWAPLGVANQLFRVWKIQPETNFERAKLTVAWHSDAWYVDSFGQIGQPRFRPAHRNRLLRPPFSWLPYGAQPPVGDSIYDRTEWQYALEPVYAIAADGSAVARVVISGRGIVNETVPSPLPPFVPLVGSTANTGGTIGGDRTVYVAFAAKDAAGKLSERSAVVAIYVPAGTNTNAVTVGSLSWASGAAGYVVYAGGDPNRLSAQAEAGGTPSSVTLTALSVATYGAPDGEYSFARVRGRRVWHSGVWGAQVFSVTSTTIKIATAVPFTTNEWAGRDVTLIGKRTTSGALVVYNARVSSNNGDTLTLAGGAPSPVGAGLAVGDVLVMRTLPTYGVDGTGQYVDDPKWVNAFAGGGLTVDEEIGRTVRVIAGTGAGTSALVKSNTATRIYADFPVPLDSTSRFIVEESNWEVVADTSAVSNASPTAELVAAANVPNEIGQTWLFQVVLIDGGGDASAENTSPVREVYLPGAAARARIQSVTSDYTVQPTDRLIEIDTTAGPITVTLPDAAEYAGQSYTFVLVDGANPATIDALGADLIDGSGTYVLTLQYESVTLTSRG